jgi:hypothetical protein
MKRLGMLCMAWLSCVGFAADVPEASAEFRAQYIKENAAACIKGIEDKPDLRTLYSHKTVETYCTCRQRYKADVIARAMKAEQRGKAVSDEAYEYAEQKCNYILIEQRESEK